MQPWLLLLLPLAAYACPMGQFSTTSSYVSCKPYYSQTKPPLIPEGIAQSTTISSTQGFITMISSPTNSFSCQLRIAPNASLGVARALSFQLFYNNLDVPINVYTCDASGACTNFYMSVPTGQTQFTVPSSGALLSIVLSPPFVRSNTFLMSWNSGINVASCPSCANLLPVPSASNWAYNSVEGCVWKCSPGFTISTAPVPLSSDGQNITTGAVSCDTVCGTCPSGQFSDCMGIATPNQGVYGAIINARNYGCKTCTVCASGYRVACSQYADAICN